MSDNSSSTGSSSGSSNNSWTLLSPEEAAVENVGPVDDGTESLGDVPSLSEEMAGTSMEFKSSDLSVETVFSEEGHQVCQETSPDSSEGPIPSSPARMSPILTNPADPSDLDTDSQPPVIHDIVTSSPSDNEHLGATPFVTNIDLGAPLVIPVAELFPAESEGSRSTSPPVEFPVYAEEEEPDSSAEGEMIPGLSAGASPVLTAEPETTIPTETLAATDPPSHVEDDISWAPAGPEPSGQDPESLVADSSVVDSPAPETVGPLEEEEEEGQEEEEGLEEEVEVTATGEMEPSEPETPEELEEGEDAPPSEPPGTFDLRDTSGVGDGLRRRIFPPFDAPRPRTSDEEDEDEDEQEFQLAERKDEKPWLSVNKCIVGALILLFLGSLFLSGEFDASELSDGEESQDWLSDPQDLKELLDKLKQENQQIAQLEARLQTQKEELDAALKAVAASGDETGKADLELENQKLKEEQSSLPELKKELESLRSRVKELNLLSDDRGKPPAASSSPQPADGDGQNLHGEKKDTPDEGRMKEELGRQKALLDESRKRLEGMKKDGGERKRVRDSLEDIQKKLSERVERWAQKKWHESKRNVNKGKISETDNLKKEEKKEWRGEKGWKEGKEGGWKDKEERKKKEERKDKEDKKKERKDKKEERKDKEDKKKEERKDQNSHKEAWRKHQDEWERKKGERSMDREQRRKEKPWHSKPGKDSNHPQQHHHHHHHHQQQPHHHHQHQPHHHHQHQPNQHHHHQQQPHQHHHHQHHQNDFWGDQEQKLRRAIHPRPGCSSVEDCAGKEGLYPVELSEFEELLEGYLSKLEGSSSENKDKVRRLTAEFFEDGVFIHDRVLFSDFAEDVADILEDMADFSEAAGQKDDDSLEEEMEEFEREALWKFAATA